MRHTLCTPRRRQSHNKTLVLVVAAGLFALAAPVAMAQVNQVTGGIGGLNNGTLQNGDGSNHAQITLIDEQLRLIKQARDLAGAVLPDATVVTPGQTVYFVLYVDNTTAFPALDIRLTDTLNEAEFTYVAASLEHTTVASGSSDAAIWSGTWNPLTDTLGAPDDLASAVDSGGPANLDNLTIGAVAAQQNQTLDIAGGVLHAFRFQVTVN